MTTRILIADNNEIARGRLTQLIQSHDRWEVCAQTENGQKALLKATELKPDIIILDLAMPVMDGLERGVGNWKSPSVDPNRVAERFPDTAVDGVRSEEGRRPRRLCRNLVPTSCSA